MGFIDRGRCHEPSLLFTFVNILGGSGTGEDDQ
jgi:hypothetical protein